MYFTYNKIKLFFTLGIVFLSICSFGQSDVFKVTLDAGHGAHDFGATYHGYVEKNISLAIATKVGNILGNYKGIKVNYTRDTDVFIDLVERANIANKVNAHVFVSIHCNANKDTKPDGSETYVMGMNKVASNLAVALKENAVVRMEKDYKKTYEGFSPNLPETMVGTQLLQELYLDSSIKLATAVESEFKKIGRKIRNDGVKQAPFMVLHKAYMTRILIETGFISNKVEGAYLNSEAGQNQMARAIANAILSYKKEYFGNGGDENNAIAKTLPADSSVPQPSKEVLSSTKIPTNPVKKVEDAPVVSQTPVVTEVPKPVVVAPNPVPVPVAVPEKKPSNTDDSSKLVYKIQFFATNKKRELIPSNFNGLEGVMEEIEGEFYKYSCGLTQDYNESKLTLSKVQQNGYPSAFLIIFKDGRKFSSKEVNEVLEIENNKAMNAQVVLATKAPIEIKKDSVKEKNVDTIPAPEKQVANEEEKIIYKVQILASKTLKDSQVFDSQGLKDVAVSYENSFYKYLYGATTDYNTSMVYLEEARSKGYNSAFLIAFKEGKKVAVEEPKK